jgi:hypothetical protein
MIKKLTLLLLIACSFFTTIAQTDTVATVPADSIADNSHLRVSLLTCGVGDEIYETFGHTAIRITDSVNGTDIVYNYGTFDGYEENFQMKFMRGKLLYYVSFYPYESFLAEYTSAKRSVQEQLLHITGPQKEAIYSFLKNNAREEYRYYKYDFFFDNCATRIRDVFPFALGSKFKYARVIPEDSRLTFRQIINEYFYRVHWQRVGVNILLGSPIDRVMTNADIMFLPDYLRDGMAGATLKGKKVAGDVTLVIPGSEHKPAGINQPLIVMLLVAMLTMAGLLVPSLKGLGKAMTAIVLFVTGLLGTLMLVMWFGTDHQGCHNNWNILWALPTNLIMAFAGKRKKGGYAITGIMLIIVALILHLLRIQQMALYELWPLLLSLLFIYGMIYKQGKSNT